MFETSILCVMAIAIAYSATLWLMGSREDVLHGEFIRPEPSADPQVAPSIALKTELPAAGEDFNALLTAIKRDLNDAAYG